VCRRAEYVPPPRVRVPESDMKWDMDRESEREPERKRERDRERGVERAREAGGTRSGRVGPKRGLG